MERPLVNGILLFRSIKCGGLNRIIKNNAAVLLFGQEPFSSALRMSNIENYRYDWVWDKVKAGNMTIAKYQPLRIHENISVFSKDKINYYPIMRKCGFEKRVSKVYSESDILGCKKTDKIYVYDEGKFPVSIIKESNADNSNKYHPTQKPVALLQYLIKTYTKENETVLDFTMGSGSTGVACKNLNRNFIGIELDEKYFNIAKQRIENGFVQEKITDTDLDKFALFQ